MRPTIQETGYLLVTLYLLFISVAALTATHVVYAGFVFLLLFLAGATHLLLANPRLEATRTVRPAALSAGNRIEVEVRIKAQRPIVFTEIYDQLSERLKIRKGSNYAFTNLKAGGELILNYEVESVVRGMESIGPLVVRARSPLSLFQKQTEVLAADQVRVYPAIHPVGEALMPRRTRKKKQGIILSTHLGTGREFYALREYLPGDSFSQINWRVTARMGKPIVNEFETEARKPIAIYLDSRAPTRTGYVESNALEQAVTVSASLADEALKRGHRVGLVVVSDEAQWVYPDGGRRQFYRILDALLRSRPAGVKPLRHWAFMTRRLLPKQGGRIVLVTPDVGDPTLIDTVYRWVAAEHDVTVVIPSFLHLQSDDASADDPTTQISEHALRLKQEMVAYNLRRLGATVLVWDPEKPLGMLTPTTPGVTRR